MFVMTTPTSAIAVNNKGWRNWSGSVRCHPQQTLAPRTLDELQQTVARISAAGGQLRVAGAGHSFVPLVETDATLLPPDAIAGRARTAKHVTTLLGGTPLKPLDHLCPHPPTGLQQLSPTP